MALTGLAVAVLGLRLVEAAASRTTVSARRDALVTEMRRLADAQDALHLRENRWAMRLDDPALQFQATPSIMVRLEQMGPESWQAVATDTTLQGAPTRCGVFQGADEAAPHRSVLTPGVVACW